ncbi:hypothetical protein [Microvirga sp. KLBC 81]|uniref:hypothetical protein n=1 Tax=Microvirga sp. KLBC 81 TaxID=1862707 RepID=UPI00197B934F|nr:hypothetical protein [Microvirga sp. KLBC 81]
MGGANILCCGAGLEPGPTRHVDDPSLVPLAPPALGSTLLAILVYVALPEAWAANSRLLTACDIEVVCYLALAGIMAARSSTEDAAAGGGRG